MTNPLRRKTKDAVDGFKLDNGVVPKQIDAEKENNNILASTPLPNGKPNGIPSNNNIMKNSPQLNNNINAHPFLYTAQETPIEKPVIDAHSPNMDTDSRRKRPSSDRGYFIAKELLATERTYHKDLEVLTVCFKETVEENPDMPEDVLTVLFSLVEPLAEVHSSFLMGLEQRLSSWDGQQPEKDRVGDLLIDLFNAACQHYQKYVDKHLLILERLDAAFRKNKKFEALYREFELQRVCHLPLSCFLVKPLQRLLHYEQLIDRLIRHLSSDHPDLADCTEARIKLKPLVDPVPESLKITENFVQLSELQRDMPTFEGLVQGGRQFIRQGWLLKHSRKGLQHRMFFLFSDILVWTNRSTVPTLQFKVLGQMPLRGVMVDERDTRTEADPNGPAFSFTIFGGNRTLVVAAYSQEEKDKWLEDLYEAINLARERNDGMLLQYLSLKSSSSSEEGMEVLGQDTLTRERMAAHRSNTPVHVCWHRNTSTCLKDHIRARSNELSGFLLRKFKKSNGWQKLWVVFTHFCLFFYKSYLDDSPLASLPLLSYGITVPSEEDEINKDFVFKLQYKNHVYFFRAESEYTFSRWMEVIGSVTQHSGRSRIFSRKDSSLTNNHA